MKPSFTEPTNGPQDDLLGETDGGQSFWGIAGPNEDGSANLAPMSSAWWLGWNCVLGFGARSHTPANLLRTGECVLNLPSVDLVGAVDRLAKTTGSDPVPPHKVAMGYRHERDKFACAGLTP